MLFTAGLLFFRRIQPARRLAPQRLANLGLILCSLAVAFNTLIVEPLSRTQRSSYFLGVVLVKDLSIATTFIVAIYSMWSYRWREDLRPMLLIVLSLAVHGLCELIYAHNLLLDYPAQQPGQRGLDRRVRSSALGGQRTGASRSARRAIGSGVSG